MSALPLTGSCPCGAVRFEVTQPFTTSNYCHCHRCQRRTGTGSSLNASVPHEGFRLTQGAEHVRTWRPEGGMPKSFCGECGGHLFSGDPEAGDPIGVRVGALDADPGIRPGWRQWMESAIEWETLPDDGLPRYPQSRPR